MGGFEILEHTADVGVRASGDTFAEALSWVAKGMFSVIADMDSVEPRKALEVSVASTETDTLVVDWLNELLYRYEADGLLFKEFQVTVDEGGKSLVGRCIGEPVDPQRHVMLTAVKAATYHDLQVSHNAQWEVQVLLDV